MSAKKRASDAKWTITLAGVVWLVAKTTTAPQFQFVHDQTLQMARLDGEAPDNASDDEGRAALPRRAVRCAPCVHPFRSTVTTNIQIRRAGMYEKVSLIDPDSAGADTAPPRM